MANVLVERAEGQEMKTIISNDTIETQTFHGDRYKRKAFTASGGGICHFEIQSYKHMNLWADKDLICFRHVTSHGNDVGFSAGQIHLTKGQKLYITYGEIKILFIKYLEQERAKK